MFGDAANGRKKRKQGKVDETEQRKLSTNDAYILFGAPFISSLDTEISDKIIN